MEDELEIVTPIESNEHSGFYYIPGFYCLLINKKGQIFNLKRNAFCSVTLHGTG